MAVIQWFYNCTESDLGNYFGMQIVRPRVKRTITILQPGCMEDIWEQHGITRIKRPLTSVVDKSRGPESESNPRLNVADIKIFPSKVGLILRPAIRTRPEVKFAVNIISKATK